MLAFVLGSMSVLSAAEPHVTIEVRSGDKISLARSDTDRINLMGESVEIISKTGESFSASRLEIVRILLSDDVSAIVSPTLSGVTVTPQFTHDILEIRNVEKQTPYKMFDLNGRLRMAGNCSEEVTSLSLEGLEKGMYLLVVDDRSFKVIKL